MLRKLWINFIHRTKPTIQIGLVLISVLVLNQNLVLAQEFHDSNSMPSYSGGNAALKDFIDKNLNYPEAALKAGISGTVNVSYLIDKEGKVQNIKVTEGLSPECDKEAIRVASLIEGWKPAFRQGKPVNINVTMPVEFKSEKKVKPAIITGKVIEKSTGLPIEGSFVIIKGTMIGSVTNADGWYRLEVPAESQNLEFMAVGYNFKEVPIDYHSTINVELDPEYLSIDFKTGDNK